MAESFYRYQGAALILRVRVQPGARSNAITGVVNGELRLRLNAPPTDGRANDMLRSFLAEQLDTTASRVSIVRGSKSRSKTVLLRGARRAPESLSGAHPAGNPQAH
ncbi:MAG TPA: DUF167 domain-containing protein [Gammaproteobacteria bacterium]|nr:DUF167 domain-containing protein [Gammaproteobacteria bacterium]